MHQQDLLPDLKHILLLQVGSWLWLGLAGVVSLGPTCVLLPMLILYPGHLIGKLSLLGGPIPPPFGRLLADGILAPMLGLTSAAALGFWTPVIVHLLDRFRWVRQTLQPCLTSPQAILIFLL